MIFINKDNKKLNKLIMNKFLKFVLYLLLIASFILNFKLLTEQTVDNAVRWKVVQLEEKRDSTASMALETLYQDSIDNLLHHWVHYKQ